MRTYVPLAVYVVAFAIGHTTIQAANDRRWVTDIKPISGAASADHPAAEINGFDQWRAVPDHGMSYSGGSGFQHFALPLHRYTNWYRPRAATLTKCRRCEKDSFRPRGLGHLFATPCDGVRMEYSPYVLCADKSQYGPSYIARQPDPRCDHCDH